MPRALAASVAVAIGTLIHAQSPSFEVASIRVNRSGEAQSVPPFAPGGRITLTNRTLRSLVQFAYSSIDAPLQESQIVGGPEWVDHIRFDILAKMEGSPPPVPATADLGRMMLRTLLGERFRFTLRRERRELPVYALVMARSDRRLGQGLRRRFEPNCDWFVPGKAVSDPGGAVPLCGYLRGGQGTLTYRGVPMSRLASSLKLDRIVVDETRLAGLFDVDLAWNVEPGGASAAATDAPSIFTAVREQLGLKLEPKMAEVDVLVIASAHQPTPD